MSKALEGERALRIAAEKRAEDLVGVAQTAVAQRFFNREIDALHTASRADVVEQIATEEKVVRLEAEIDERELRLKELEAMLSTHDQLQNLMAEAVQAAEDARDDADNARRLADENLKVMRAEFDRLSQ